MKVKKLHEWLGNLIERGYEDFDVMMSMEDDKVGEVTEVRNIVKGTTRIYLE